MNAAACFLFGSAARGDADRASDLDVLVVYAGDPSIADRQNVKKVVGAQFNRDCAFAEYTWARLCGMFVEGHLFAWHLFHESRRLPLLGTYDWDLSFPIPAPYRSHRRDALNFLNLLETCVHAVKFRTASMVYEAGLGYVAIRNIGMSLSALALPRPEFDRHVPFKVARELCTSPPCDLAIYDLMVAARHSSQRGFDEPSLDTSALLSSLVEARSWAKEALEVLHECSDV